MPAGNNKTGLRDREVKQIRLKKMGERGVSPVIGVVLMVGLTVALAAIISSFVLGIGMPKMPPDIQFSSVSAIDDGGTDNDRIEALVLGTEKVSLDDLVIRVGGENAEQNAKPSILSAGKTLTVWRYDNITVDNAFANFEPGDTVSFQIVHTPSGKIIFDGEPVAESGSGR